MLPTSKMLTVPRPDALPAPIVSGNDRTKSRWTLRRMLNDGYGTQSRCAPIDFVLDLKTNQIVDYPDPRLGDDAHQSYFLGLVFSSDGKHLFASVGSLTDRLAREPATRETALPFMASLQEESRPGFHADCPSR